MHAKHPDRIIVFTRLPAPGTTKTRLIPALGARGAADLQKRMTGHTLDRVRSFACRFPVSVEVRGEGGDANRIRAWLGEDLIHAPQGAGDLGQRMARAFREAFASGARRVLLIGSDCPGMGPAVLEGALRALRRAPVVIGPALDGGYVLLGLRAPCPALFEDVPWGSSRVLERTLEAAAGRGIRPRLLEPLADVDRPEDLPVWDAQSRRSPWGRNGFSLSVVIPTLNEAGNVLAALESTRDALDVAERIVVDGGSGDGTPESAEAWGARVVASPPGRAAQMNRGARVSRGRVLLFLHADCRLPYGFEAHVRRILACPRVVAGAFRHAIDGRGRGLRLIERLANFRSDRLAMPYGDQGIFLTAERFREAGGFPEMPIMEDFELMRRLRRLGRVRVAPAAAVSSARRYRQRGILRTTWINQLVIAGYAAGVAPERLAAWYRRGAGPGSG